MSGAAACGPGVGVCVSDDVPKRRTRVTCARPHAVSIIAAVQKMALVRLLLGAVAVTHGLRLPLAAPPAAAAAVAACLFCSTPTLAAEPPTAITAPKPAQPTTDADATLVRGTVNGKDAVLATDAEAKELRAAAQDLSMPSVPTNSDLGRLLAGEGPSGASVQSPRAHSN